MRLIQIDHHVTILSTGRSSQEHIIEIEANRRGVAAARGHAAHLDLRLTWSFALQRDTWRALCEGGQGGDATSEQIVGELIHERHIVCSPNAFLCHPLGANDGQRPIKLM